MSEPDKTQEAPNCSGASSEPRTTSWARPKRRYTRRTTPKQLALERERERERACVVIQEGWSDTGRSAMAFLTETNQVKAFVLWEAKRDGVSERVVASIERAFGSAETVKQEE